MLSKSIHENEQDKRTDLSQTLRETDVLYSGKSNGFIVTKYVRNERVLSEELPRHSYQKVLRATFLVCDFMYRSVIPTLYHSSPPMHLKSSEDREFPITLSKD